MAFSWFVRSDRTPGLVAAGGADAGDSRMRRIGDAMTGMRRALGSRITQVNQMTADEVTRAARLLDNVVERARSYVQESQRVLGKLEGRDGEDSVGQLLGAQSALLHNHARDMSGRVAMQDERARQAAAAANSIGDLAATIDRLAGEARLIAVNARIECSRLGAHSAGFEVLATEMHRLSDEVASANERVSELAARLGSDLPWIAQHARDLRVVMESFAKTAATTLGETERGVDAMRANVASISRAGGEAMEDILRASQGALSHLQFQDVVAQELRMMDARMRDAHVEVANAVGAGSDDMAAIPAAEYMTQGAGQEGSNIAPSGDVVLF